MNEELEEILGSNENNKMADAIEQMRTELANKMEEVFKPVYKKVLTDPIDVLLLPNLKPTEKMIMVVLRNRESATIDQLIALSGSNKQTCNKSLNNLRNLGYVVKLKVSTYALAETKIY